MEKHANRLKIISLRLGVCILIMISFCGFTDDAICEKNNRYIGETIYGTIDHDGLQREYLIYIPASYNGYESVPLVFNFHSFTSYADEYINRVDFREIADIAGFIVVYPQGSLYYGLTHWSVGGIWIGSTTDDVGFTDVMIDFFSSEYNIDQTRIYATGFSNGGYMSHHLACLINDKFAAIAAVAGSMTPFTLNNSTPIHPTPILQIHGTSDPLVQYDGNYFTLSVDSVLQYWVEYNYCNPIAMSTTLPDIDTTDGSTVEHIVYPEGDNGVTVEHFKIIGGGHKWPGTGQSEPGTNYDIDATTEIWNFFSRYDINGLITSNKLKPSFSLTSQILDIPAFQVHELQDWYSVSFRWDGSYFIFNNDLEIITFPSDTTDTATYKPETGEVILPWISVLELPDGPVYSGILKYAGDIKFEIVDLFQIR